MKDIKSLIAPTKLKPIDKMDGTLQVIVETPKGCRNKFAFEQGVFALKKAGASSGASVSWHSP